MTLPIPVPVPEPLPAAVIDSHCHLDIARAPDEPAAPLETALRVAGSVGVVEVVQVGCDLESARRAVRWSREHTNVHAAVSLHPTEAAQVGAAGRDTLDRSLDEIAELAADPVVVAVGESGLDHYWTTDVVGREMQEHAFRSHVRIARETGKTLVIHDRDAHEDVVRVLEDEGPPERVVFHCFSGDSDMARHCVQSGWFLSVAGPVTFRNAEPLRSALRTAVELAGLSQVLVETDAPYLTPHPHRGRVNGSYLLPWTVRALAEVAGEDLVATCHATRDATRRAFSI